ncbi:MAG: 23S rRNA (uracil(1939)-C(5))-methyltransferase RlmD [Fusobacterium varium]|uniref:23S rRNA (uracil(1939)-C(5))-methyltransferase RlmD n=1 Tax=Fusobacterium varium TaxID=856 RepID=UPI002430F5E0|nr:23S rRNA (uracil(1939)-C(5))-methyltransferase RlmD [Fusobacterium varium]MCF0170422.1 23S rRNA (uracil(1939)-C(5))-methyltransferase RlmD [Fusobacterium varium]
MVKKFEIIELKVDKIVNGGEGLGYYNDFAVFVPMSVPGDVLKVKIISVKKTYARGLIEEIISAGEERVEDINKISFEDFQGCDFGMLKYDAQLKYKKLMVEDVLKKIGKMDNISVADVIGSEDPYHYRNKIIEPFRKSKGEIISGFFKRKSHDVFEVEENILNSRLGNKIIKELKSILNREKVSVYDENEHKGILRNVMVRTNSKNEAMLVLIINAVKVEKRYKDILMELKNKVNEIKSIYISLNPKRTNVALGEKNVFIWGEKTITEEIDGISFNISPLSFFQINLPQTKKLYSTAVNYFKDIENKNVVDAYSGTGTLAMILSKKAKKVFAIELVQSATNDGIKTAKENGISNIEFINGAVEDKLPELIKKGEKVDAIIFDPPRKGIEESSLLKVAESNIKEIVYISCNPSTFARDAEILSRQGYTLEKVQPVDMFPGTAHTEIVGRFIK